MNIKIRNTGIVNFLKTSHNKERCGMMFGEIEGDEVRVIRLIECPNASPNPRAHFYITRYNVEKAIRQTKLKPLGYFHTHLAEGDVEPSQKDIEQMRNYPRSFGMIYNPPSGTMTYFSHRGVIDKEFIY